MCRRKLHLLSVRAGKKRMKTRTRRSVLSAHGKDLSERNKDPARDIWTVTFHRCHRRRAHNALIFYAHFPLKQHNVRETGRPLSSANVNTPVIPSAPSAET